MDDSHATGECPPVRSVAMLVNPGKREVALVGETAAALGSRGVTVTDIAFDEAAPFSSFVERLRAFDAVAVAGGDGTMNRAARLLLAARRPVAIVPAGTANDLARTLGLPADASSIAAVIAGGRVRAIDLGEVNGRPFFNVVSVGMSADLARDLTREAKARWGRLAYAITAVRIAFAARRFRADIVGEAGTVRVQTLQIAVGNGRYYGGGMAIEETAAIDDGHLHLYSLEMTSAWAMLPMLWAFRRGTHGRWASVRTLVGDRFEIRTRRPRTVNADGELIGTTPCVVRILPSSLEVLVP